VIIASDTISVVIAADLTTATFPAALSIFTVALDWKESAASSSIAARYASEIPRRREQPRRKTAALFCRPDQRLRYNVVLSFSLVFHRDAGVGCGVRIGNATDRNSEPKGSACVD
jgi:hypothetical protein